MHLTRRELLQLLGAGAIGVASGCGDDLDGTERGVATAVLEPDAGSFIVAVWTRLRVGDATIELRAAGALRLVTGVALIGGIGARRITGLAADTRYEVAIIVGRLRIGPHRVRTAPAPEDGRPVRVAVFADVDPSPEFESGMLDALAAEEPELAIAIGDFPYTDNGPPAQTLAEYRERHAQLRTHPPVRRLLEASGLRAIYDDHEFRNDWDAGSVAAEPARYAAAMQAWDEFFPLAAPGEIKYRSWRWGAQLECFLLDCRRFRSADAALDDARKTMLGAAQRRWLIDGVTRSSATFKLILSSVPLDFGLGDDSWSSFVTERDFVFAALVGTPGVVFVSGDQHWFAAQRHAYGIREMQVGPIARGLGRPGPAGPGVMFRAERYNAGLVEIDGDRLTLSGLGDDGSRFYSETVTADDLTPRSSA
ncbi:MAG TPA: alkaline phosphatase D family protein [Kofleriaceae bacterium]|nr:alkaline phosphatase D family protein [Kofleriaceae bacterium]